MAEEERFKGRKHVVEKRNTTTNAFDWKHVPKVRLGGRRRGNAPASIPRGALSAHKEKLAKEGGENRVAVVGEGPAFPAVRGERIRRYTLHTVKNSNSFFNSGHHQTKSKVFWREGSALQGDS